MAKKGGLGRGLDALIPGLSISDDDRIQEIPLADLRPNPYQPRKTFDPEALKELAESIRTHGVLTPILVRRAVHGYEIIAGERRVRAAEMAGLKTVPAVERKMSDAEMMEVALIENIQREDLNPLEIAEAYRAVMERFALTQEELARRMGKSRSQVANTLRLLTLPEEVRAYVSRGTLTMGHAKILAGVADERRLVAVARQAAEEGWSVRKLEEALRAARPKPAAGRPARSDRSPEAARRRALESRLRERFGTPVTIRGEKRGRIEIAFVDEEDLRRLVDLLLGPEAATEVP